MINFYMLYAFDHRYDLVWDLPGARRHHSRRLQGMWSSCEGSSFFTALRLVLHNFTPFSSEKQRPSKCQNILLVFNREPIQGCYFDSSFFDKLCLSIGT